jgi:flagellar hook-length control protein FliK
MSQVKENLGSQPLGKDGQISMKLHPEELGELKINMRMENQHLKIEIVADNRSVKEALIQNMDSLKETLSRQNIVMERFEVLTGGGNSNSGDSYRGWKQMQEMESNFFRKYGSYAQESSQSASRFLESDESSLVSVRL